MPLDRFTFLRTGLLLFLILSTAAILVTTYQNSRSTDHLAEQAMESTALALAGAVESELRSGNSLSETHVRRPFSDRVVAYALVSDPGGRILFHTNPALIETRLEEPGLGNWLRSGKAYGRRISLKTGLPAFEFNYILHLSDGRAELLRLVLHTYPADQIVARARNMWWTVALVLLILWTVGVLLERLLVRQIHLQEVLQRREQMATIGQMTAVLAHEIRNALGSIKGYTQWIDEKTEEKDPKKSGLTLVLQGIERIESLVNDLLLYAREESYHLEPLAVEKILHELKSMGMIHGTVKLGTGLDQDYHLLADKEKIHRVLWNGIQNALQSEENDKGIQVKIETRGKWVEFRIEDYGPGIPEEELPRLFTPFHTTKTTGTGLGLAYSKKVIEGMGGEISLSNHPEHRGAVLSIKLPRAERP